MAQSMTRHASDVRAAGHRRPIFTGSVKGLQSGSALVPNAHLVSLTARHARLDASLSAEMRRPMPDTALVAKLKREKLKLKDEVEHAAQH